MGQKVIFECDFCKGQSEPNQCSVLSFKKTGQKRAKPYDICESCAKKVQEQLIGNKSLPTNWTLGASNPEPDYFNQSSKTVPQGDVILEDEIKQDKILSSGPKTITPNNGGPCPHYNKGSFTLGVFNGVQGFYQRCRDCDKILDVRKKEKI